MRAGELLVGKMKAAATPAEGDKIVKELYADLLQACGDDGKFLWQNRTLENTKTPLLMKNTWFLKKRLNNHPMNWSPDCLRLMMLFKGVCDAVPKDFSYSKVDGVDEALKVWRSGSNLAKWLRTECQKAYRRQGNDPTKKTGGKTGNLAAAEEEDSTIQSGGETIFGANLGTSNGYLQG